MDSGEAAAMLAHVLDHYGTRHRPRGGAYPAAELELVGLLLASARAIAEVRRDCEGLAGRAGLEGLCRGLLGTGAHGRMFAACSRFVEELDRHGAVLEPRGGDGAGDAPGPFGRA